MGRVIDALIAYRVLKLLVTPFNRTNAYKFGIIDDKGKVLIKSKDLPNSGPKREAYTLLIRFVFNLKRLLSKVGIRGPLTTSDFPGPLPHIRHTRVRLHSSGPRPPV